ncbi:alpha/beta hydrolase [Paenibacillus pasadenensis]|uniref:alpha/beta fold hydrolase n=1 Tax=Paenibacillus pasadenensis TaxID=217090 RepID=UPI00203F7BEE|nr:alpha/beta fold hydrolase [Paenibacillus pasadenensis]MCM3749645.1 alpha/beta hydrolase [Paenibacillus pasadenensis]
MKEIWAQSGGVQIHGLDSGADESSRGMLPLMICPGLSMSAEEYIPFMELMTPRRCIVLSFRGRGQSATPESGYTLEEHLEDVIAIREAAQLERYHLYGYSRGVSYALALARNEPERIQSLMLLDYPPVHLRMTREWAEGYINDYLIPSGRTKFIRPEAVWGIQRESDDRLIAPPAELPQLVMRGLLEGSLLPDDKLELYLSRSEEAEVRAAAQQKVQGQRQMEVRHFPYSAHDVFRTEPDALASAVREWMNRYDVQP